MNRPPTCCVTSSPHEGRVGRGPRRGESKVNAPPLPSPLLLPASGGEGENPARKFRGSVSALSFQGKSLPDPTVLESAAAAGAIQNLTEVRGAALEQCRPSCEP